MPDSLDPYRVLGVTRGATKAQIKAAHRTLAKRYHPDSSTGDARRFRDVHEAYQLLADPLRRREWDAHHAPGPVRADEQPSAPRRRRPPAADNPGPTPPTARTYRWSASEVPWWEEGVRAENRRQPGARRPKGGEAATDDQPARQSADFEVYNRSSGAAWSSAARQYFRRFDAELPKHGQFRRQGTQPLTAARARVAADEEARARSRQSTPPPPRPPVTPPPPRPTYSYAAGVAHSTEQVNAARAATQRAKRAAAWPSLRERLLIALIAWVPLALLIGYGGSAATACDRFAASCPAWYAPLQTVFIAMALGLLVALPRVAYVAAFASLSTLGASIVLVALLALGRIQPPLPEGIAIGGLAVLITVYILTAVVVALNRSQLPWVVPR
jgi:curved DNA-binding protein CbpA